MDEFVAKVNSIFRLNDTNKPQKKEEKTNNDKKDKSNIVTVSPSNTVKIHIQKIGQQRDRTNDFLQKRKQCRLEEEKNTRNKLDQLSKVLYVAPKTTSPFTPLIRTFSFSKQNSNQNYHCLVCGIEFGILTKKVQCALCSLFFCSKCIKKLTHKEITAVVAEGDELLVCPRCFIVVTREENSRKFQDKKSNYLKKVNSLIKIYEILRSHKDEIRKLVAQYEYLTESLNTTFVSNAQAKKDGNFSAVFENASTTEKRLVALFKEFQLNIKKFVCEKVFTGRELKVKQNIQNSMMNFLSEHLPRFRRLRRDLVDIEMKTLNNLYIITYRLADEDVNNNSFWDKFGKYFLELLKIIEKDLIDAVIATGEKWYDHKKYLDEFLNSWTSHSAPLISLRTDTEIEATLIRKNLSILNDLNKKFEGKVGEVELLSRQALVALIHRLEDSYYEGTQTPQNKRPQSDNPYYPLPHPYFSLADLQKEEDEEGLGAEDDWHFVD